MATVNIGGRMVRLAPGQIIGKGGEADIYKIDGTTVLKLYKTPTHADLVDDNLAQTAALVRIKEQQRKLPAFPHDLPVEVVAPTELAFDRSGRDVVGYVMPLASGMDVLMNLSNRPYRETNGINGNQVLDVFRELHRVVAQTHARQVVIGDFNDLNVMTDNKTVKLIDTDSMQFGGFKCLTFTTRFVDPLLCRTDALSLARPHNESSDWYAFFVMLLQSLLYVGPYGGVHRPTSGGRLQHDARVLARLTVLGSDVVYPKPALPLGVLPDELLDYMGAIFERDQRESFPQKLLDGLRFTTCSACGAFHARSICPACSAPGVVRQTVTIRGQVTARRVFKTTGHILQAVNHGGVLRYLYQENGVLYREGGKRLMHAELSPEIRFKISDERTLIGAATTLITVTSSGDTSKLAVDQYRGRLPIFDANESSIFWVANGQLMQEGRLEPKYLGDILEGQTLFWAGKHLGFGFYQAGQIMRAFVFEPNRRGLNDQVKIPAFKGQLIDAVSYFGDKRVWFMVSVQEQGILTNRCFVIDINGTVLATAEAEQGNDTWLGRSIRGHMATGQSLFVATDEGIVRLTSDRNQIIVERKFPDTESFVDNHSSLVQGPGGIYVVSSREVTLLEIR